MHIGSRIKRKMLEKKISTKRMAEHVGISPSAVSQWFDSGRISKDSLTLAADLLGCDVRELISGEEREPPALPGYSTEALALAWLLDQVKNKMDKKAAETEAAAAIIRYINKSA